MHCMEAQVESRHASRCMLAVFPKAPRRCSGSFKLVQYLLVSERVHALPEAVVTLRPHLTFRHKTTERFIDELFAGIDVAEDFLAQNKVSAIHPDIRVRHALDAAYTAFIVGNNSIQATGPRLHRQERSITIAARKLLNHFRKIEIRQSVAVVSQKHLFAVEMRLDKP